MADGTLAGTVEDVRSMQPIGNATIDAKGEGGQEHKATSGPDGSFGVDVAPGVYDVVVTASGYDTGDYPGVYVFEGTTTTLRFALWPSEY